MTDERLKELYQEALARRQRAGAGECVSPEALTDLVARRGPEKERLGVLGHVMSCPDCRAEFELLRSIDLGARREKRTRWVPNRAAALAASVTILAGAGLMWQLSRGGQPDVLRGPGSGPSLIAPAGDLRGEPVEFAWRPLENATSYRLQVTAPGGDVVFDAVARDTVLPLPATVTLAEGVEYLWWVEARVNGTVSTASPQTFRVRRE